MQSITTASAPSLLHDHPSSGRATATRSVPLPRRLRIRRKCWEPSVGLETKAASSIRRRSGDGCLQQASSRSELGCLKLSGECSGRGELEKLGLGAEALPLVAHLSEPQRFQLPSLLGTRAKAGGCQATLELPRLLSSPKSFAVATGMKVPPSAVLEPLEAFGGFEDNLNACRTRLRRAASHCTASSFCTATSREASRKRIQQELR